MYGLYDYGLMLADPRAARYADALRRTIRPGAVVVEIGSGPGVLAVHACLLGARHVYAIDSDEVIALAGQIAAANGVSDRLTAIRGDSRLVPRTEPADIVLADVRGVLPFEGESLGTMIDARRFLKPGGVLIPQRDRVWVSLVNAPALYAAIIDPWRTDRLGVNATPAKDVALNLFRKARFDRHDLVATPALSMTLDYTTLETTSADGRVRLVAERASVAHGLAVWFDSDLVDGVTMSSAPGEPPLLYGQAFFPWPEAVRLEAGDEVLVTFRAQQTAGGCVLTWESGIGGGARFVQSTFRGLPFDLETAYLHSPDAVVTPGPDSAIEQFVLSAFDGRRTQSEIAAALAARFPDSFSSPREALARVVSIALRVARTRGQVALRE